MRADADEAVRRFAAESFVTPTPALMQGIARILCGDLDGSEVSLEDAVSVGEQIGSPEHVAIAAGQPQRADLYQQFAGVRKHSPWSARCEPVRPCTGQTCAQYIRSSPVLSGYGIC